ncbi:MAG: YfcE family phosphodiesterase [Deltaproteobacteria bacterium]|uniref:Phosphoesterase n=2 Tax=Desulforhabdus amnigena TaxID=40218 RepID=A0A9W6FUD1_9BACT|nr:YfcE family phosphodiesterase [Deltaproteobacteria bacterium]GLI35051.1 phosphoesterase [Desulforhabdus amnigena]
MSDTHLRQVTDEFRRICSRYCDDADMVIHLGDWARSSILDFMEQYPLEAVAGNTDDHVIQDRLPTKKVIRVGSHRIGIAHGWGAASDLPKRLRNEFIGVDAVLFGHTHVPLNAEENGIFWFNPGSVFLGRGSSERTLGILHINERIQGEIIRL